MEKKLKFLGSRSLSWKSYTGVYYLEAVKIKIACNKLVYLYISLLNSLVSVCCAGLTFYQISFCNSISTICFSCLEKIHHHANTRCHILLCEETTQTGRNLEKLF